MIETEHVLSAVWSRDSRLLLLLLAQIPCLWFLLARSMVPVLSTIRERIMVRSATFTELVECAFCSGFWTSALVWGPMCREAGAQLSADWTSACLATFLLALPCAGVLGLAQWSLTKNEMI